MCYQTAGAIIYDGINQKVGDKEYSKWIVALSLEDIEKLGWHDDQELDAKVREMTN